MGSGEDREKEVGEEGGGGAERPNGGRGEDHEVRVGSKVGSKDGHYGASKRLEKELPSLAASLALRASS